MNFFEHQDQAKRGTGRLIAYLSCAVLGIIVSIYLLVAGLLFYGEKNAKNADLPSMFDPALILAISGVTIVVIVLGSLYKMAQLKGGGKVVAESMGGRLLNHDTSDAIERRLLNVVDEMAIASGVPSPPVYLMDHEHGINAFAAGDKISNSVIGVTRGTAETLSRDELQGVIAHEFSHILNGDVKMNLRLIGLVHGIMIIGIIGYYLLRATAGYRHYSRDRGKGGNPLPLIGLGLMVIGFVGTLFGNIIKASVSRQREFLADASAVQFTRNPDGIAGALRRIGGYKKHGEVENAHASEISHMFFVKGLSSGIAGLFATHPPLPERIKRIDPNWNANKGWITQPHAEFSDSQQTAGFAGGSGGAPAPVASESIADNFEVGGDFKNIVIGSIGTVNHEQVQYAHALLGRLPEPVIKAAHDAYGARALILSLLIDQDDADAQSHLEALKSKLDPNLFFQVKQLVPKMSQIQEADRLPLVDIALPHLGGMSRSQLEDFMKNVRRVIAFDRKVDLFEWSLARILEHHLEAAILPPPPESQVLADDTEKVSFFISWLAHMGHDSEDQAKQAHEKAMSHFGDPAARFFEYKACSLPAVSRTIDQIAQFEMSDLQRFIETSLVCITADNHVDLKEYEILRCVATTLDIPMPPLQPSMAS